MNKYETLGPMPVEPNWSKIHYVDVSNKSSEYNRAMLDWQTARADLAEKLLQQIGNLAWDEGLFHIESIIEEYFNDGRRFL